MKKKREPRQYEVANIHRNCCHAGCRNIVTSFAYPIEENPETVPVWCRAHQSDAGSWRRNWVPGAQ